MFAHHNIHKYTSTPSDGKTHIYIDHNLTDKMRYIIIVDIRYFGGAHSDIDYDLVVANARGYQ